MLGGRCVAMLHGIDSERAKWGRLGRWVLRLGERAAGRRADACLVLSEHMKAFMKKRYGCEAVITNNGTDRTVSDPEKTEQVLASLGLKKDGYILFMARIVPEKVPDGFPGDVMLDAGMFTESSGIAVSGHRESKEADGGASGHFSVYYSRIRGPYYYIEWEDEEENRLRKLSRFDIYDSLAGIEEIYNADFIL